MDINCLSDISNQASERNFQLSKMKTCAEFIFPVGVI